MNERLIAESHPILRVFHDHDGDWQFLSGDIEEDEELCMPERLFKASLPRFFGLNIFWALPDAALPLSVGKTGKTAVAFPHQQMR